MKKTYLILRKGLTLIIIFYHVNFPCVAIASAVLVTLEHQDRFRCPPWLAYVMIGMWVFMLLLWGVAMLYLPHIWRRFEKTTSAKLLTRYFLLSLPVYGAIYYARRILPLLNKTGSGGAEGLIDPK